MASVVPSSATVISIIIARYYPVILLYLIFDQRGLYENIQCMKTYTAMTVDCLAQLYVTARLRLILLFSRLQVPLHIFAQTMAAYSCYLAPGGVCEVLFSPGLSGCVCVCACLSVCVSVCPANILIFYCSATRRDIDLKLIQDTYRVVLDPLKKLTFQFVFHRHLLGYSIR